MKLKAVKIKNFRGYKEHTLIKIEDGLTTIIGKNDIGKSTVLEALAIFFDEESVKPEAKDMNCIAENEGEKFFEITCEFGNLPSKIILDDKAETTLKDEYLLNQNNNLEIVKRYRASTGKEEGVYIRCLHPTATDVSNLLSCKITELRKRGEKYKDQVRDKRIAADWRKAIRDGCPNLQLQESLIDVKKGFEEDAKSIWININNHLPLFSLFKADRESNDGDVEVKSPLQYAVKMAQEEYRFEIEAIERKIRERVVEVTQLTLEKLKDMNPELAKRLIPEFKERPKWVFNFTLEGDDGITINKRGSGVRRLVLLNFFRAEVELHKEHRGRDYIYAIEEPETAQHPDNQKMIIEALLNISQREGRQIIVTTHVPSMIGLVPAESVRLISKHDSRFPKIEENIEQVLAYAIEELGVLPDIGIAKARAVVLVEGKGDELFLTHAANCFKSGGLIPFNFDDEKIIILPVGGSGSVRDLIEKKTIDKFGVPWCVFMDSDKGDDGAHKRQIRNKEIIQKSGHACFLTRKREIENYLDPILLSELTSKTILIDDCSDAKKEIANKVGIRGSSVIENYWPQMSLQNIEQSSTYITPDGEKRNELLDIVLEILKLVDN